MKNQTHRFTRELDPIRHTPIFQNRLLNSFVPAALLIASLGACSSAPPKPAAQELDKLRQTAPQPEAVDTKKFAPGVDAVEIPTSSKSLTPVPSGPTITLKKDANLAKAGAEPSTTTETPTKTESATKSENAASFKVTKPAIVGVAPETSLRWLKNGNNRFVKGWFRKDGQGSKDIQRIVSAHRPHAVVLASTDSRVPPELVFDQKLGEIFTVRSLGPSLSPEILGSIEYAIMNLGTRNLVVLGHSSCGGAKVAYIAMDEKYQGSANLKSVIADIQPRIQRLVSDGKKPSKNFMDECWANTLGVAADLKTRSEVLRKAVESKELEIHSALYDLETGKVEFRD